MLFPRKQNIDVICSLFLITFGNAPIIHGGYPKNREVSAALGRRQTGGHFM